MGEYIKSANNILEWRLVIEDESIPLESICERIRAIKKEKSISAAFIDYIQLIGCNRNVKLRNEEIGYIMSELKNVAKELDYYRSNPSNCYGFDPMDAEVIVAKYPNMQEIPVTIPMSFSAENGWY